MRIFPGSSPHFQHIARGSTYNAVLGVSSCGDCKCLGETSYPKLSRSLLLADVATACQRTVVQAFVVKCIYALPLVILLTHSELHFYPHNYELPTF